MSYPVKAQEAQGLAAAVTAVGVRKGLERGKERKVKMVAVYEPAACIQRHMQEAPLLQEGQRMPILLREEQVVCPRRTLPRLAKHAGTSWIAWDCLACVGSRPSVRLAFQGDISGGSRPRRMNLF